MLGWAGQLPATVAGLAAGDRVKKQGELRGLLRPRQQHSPPGAMPSYTVTVATGSQWFAGTDDYIYLSLIGSAGCSEKHLLDKAFYNDFERGAVRMHILGGEGWRQKSGRRGEAGRRPGLYVPAPETQLCTPSCERIWDPDAAHLSRCMSGKVGLG